MASSILSSHPAFFPDDTARRVRAFEPFEAHPDDNLYTSPPTSRDTSSLFQRIPPSVPESPQPRDMYTASSGPPLSSHSAHHLAMNNPLYQQSDSVTFHGPVDFASNAFPTSTTAFSSSGRSRQHETNGSSGTLSHQSSLSALYGPDLVFQSGAGPSDAYPPPAPQQSQQSIDRSHSLHHHSSHTQLPGRYNDAGPFDHQYDYAPPPPPSLPNHADRERDRAVRHQKSFGSQQSSRSMSLANLGGGLGSGDSNALNAPYSNGAAPAAHGAGSGYANMSSGPTLRETLRDAREPPDSGPDGRGAGKDGGHGGAEEISTIFVVGFPDDMQEREFQNMFTFSRGFEAATLKIPNKDSTAYNGASVAPNAALNASTSASSASNASTSSNERRGTITGATYAGANDPYNLVTVNSGGVVVDARDLPGGTQTSAVWPSGMLPSSASSSVDDHSYSSHQSSTAAGGAGVQAPVQSQQQQPPRKQIIGFAKFATRPDALYARDVLQSKRVDADKPAVLKAEMAKKNLHTKRGVGSAQTQTAGGGAGHGTSSQLDGGAERRPTISTRDNGPPGLFASLPSAGLPLVNGNGPIAPGALSQLTSAGGFPPELTGAYSISSREREQAALAAMGVSSTVGGNRGFRPMGADFSDNDMVDDRQLQQQQRQELFWPGRGDGYHHHRSSMSVSGSSSVSSFSPEADPAARNIPIMAPPLNSSEGYQPRYSARFFEDMFRARGFEFNYGEGDINATPVAHPSGWPAHLQHREFENDEDPHRFDLESRSRSTSLTGPFPHDVRSDSRSPPLSASGLRLHGTVEESFDSQEPVGSSSFESGVGDATVVVPDRNESQTIVHQEHPALSSSVGSSNDLDLHSTELATNGSEGPKLANLPSSDDVLENSSVKEPSPVADVGPWPRPPSTVSASTRSARSSAAPETLLSQQLFSPPPPHQHPTSVDSSSLGSGSPPDFNGGPNGLAGVNEEEDEQDQVSPLHSHHGFQSIHQHLPLNPMPRHHHQHQQQQHQQHQLPSSSSALYTNTQHPAHSRAPHDADRNTFFNEAIFDASRNGGGGAVGTNAPNNATLARNRDDLAGLEGRFDDFSLGPGGGHESETSPFSSPPLPSMTAALTSRAPSAHNDRSHVDQNPPINTLYVGNLPTSSTSSSHNAMLEESLRQAFSKCAGYRKLCFRQKSNGPMCFIEFEDVQYATKALNDMYGNTLNGLVKNGIRLSYSKNPLGVRSPSISGGTGPSLAGVTFQGLHETSVPNGRHASVDGGRPGQRGSFFVDSNAPPRRQQLRDDGMQDSRVISNPFDGSVIGPRSTRQMSLGPGVGFGSLGDFVSGGRPTGLDALQGSSFGGGGVLNGMGAGPANGGPYSSNNPAQSQASRLPSAARYFAPAPGDGLPPRSALSPIVSPTLSGASSAFSSMNGFGNGLYGGSEMVSPPMQHAQAQAPMPRRSSFSPFHNDMFGGGGNEPQFDERDHYGRNNSLIGHFGANHYDDGGHTLYNSDSFNPLGGEHSMGGSEQR